MDPLQLLLHGGELVVVGGKQGLGPQLFGLGAVFQHRPGDGHAVIGGGAPADLVQNEQGVAGGVLEQLGHFAHLHHEGGLSGGQVVGGPDAGEHPVHHADVGGAGGDIAAHLGHEHNEGHLAHVGGFTCHVGAGDDGQTVLVFVHVGVVGHEKGVFQGVLHHRVAALLNVNDPALVHHRAAVVALHRHRGKGEEHVQLGHAACGPLYLPHPGGHRVPQLAEQLVLQGGDAGLGGENLVLQVLELGGDEPLTADQGLLADVVLGHQVVVGLGHLDVVAEHLIIPDLQALDAGALLLPALQSNHHIRPVGEDVPQVVHLLVVAGADEVALSDGEGEAVVVVLVPDGPINGLLQVLQAQHAVLDALHGPAGQSLQLGGQGGEHPQALGQGLHVPGIGGAVAHLADESFQVGHLAQGVAQLLPGHQVVHQGGHPVLTAGDGQGGAQGALQPGPNHPVAHGGAGAVQHPEEGALLVLAAHGLGELQVAPGGEVQLHVQPLVGLLHHQGAQVGEVGLLGLGQVPGQSAGGLVTGQVLLRQRSPRLPQPAHLQGGPGGLGGKLLFGSRLAQAVQPLAEEFHQLPLCGGLGGENGLAGGTGGELVAQVGQPVGAGEGGGVELSGGHVAHRHTRPVPVQVHAADVIVVVLVQHHVVHGGAGGDDAHDVPLHQALGGGGVLHLLADGHLIAPLDKSGDVVLGGVVGHPAHGGALLLRLVAVPGGEGEAQLLGADFGVVLEHLVKVPQPEEKQAIGIVLLHFDILFHHGGEFRHGVHDLSICCCWAIGQVS